MTRRSPRKPQTPRARADRRGRRAPRPRRRGSRLGALLRWTLVVAIWAGVLSGGAFVWYAFDLPDIDDLATPARRPSVTLLAADGTPFATYGDVHGNPVSVRTVPPYLVWAVVATEDRRFYEHGGIDLIGVARAALVNLREGEIRQGGSTLTQQLAKNLFLTPERTLDRKIRESILALRLERRFTKEQILTIYLNRVYLGAGTWGVDAAARRYFGKPAVELNLYEAAMIAGLLKAPSRYNPANDPDLAHRRALVVLDSMVDAGFLKPEAAAKAERLRRRGVVRAAPAGHHFADWVLDRVRGYVGYVDRDLVVATTFAPALQAAAEAGVARLFTAEAARAHAGQAALVAMAPDGAVRAMIGGRDYGKSQFNRATQALRQPGSVFKPMVYLAALEAGYAPDSHFFDGPISIGDWRPRNFDNRYFGDVTMREAVRRSLNSVAVQASEKIGRKRVIDVAERLGITSDLRPHPSIALGASEVSLLEMTGAYAVFANGGEGVWPYGVLQVRDSQGKVLYRRAGAGPGRVIEAEAARAMNDLLRGVVDDGTGRAADLDRPAAGKTGTSQDFRDAWFIGYTAELVTGVWVGNDDGAPMQAVTGGGLPARLWHAFMTKALAGMPPRPLPALARAERRWEPRGWNPDLGGR